MVALRFSGRNSSLIRGSREGNSPLHLESVEITAQTGLPMIELITRDESSFTSIDDFIISFKNEEIEPVILKNRSQKKNYEKSGETIWIKGIEELCITKNDRVIVN